MSNDEFETWLSLVGRLLGLSERQRSQIGAELRDHLESRVADLLESGMDKNSAVMQAVEEFGDAAILAKNLQSVSLRNRKRWMMRFMTLATAGSFLVALLTMAMWPEDARFGSPSQTVAQDAVTATAPVKASPSSRSRSNDEIRSSLNNVGDLVYDASPFGDVLKELSSKLQLNIVIDANLEGVLDADTEISANLTGIRLSDGLRTMLKPVDATYAIQGGVLMIIAIDDEYEPDYLSRHMIDVRELLELVKNAESDRVGKPIAATKRSGRSGGGFGGGGRGGGVFCIPKQLGSGAAGSPSESAPVVGKQKAAKEDAEDDEQLYVVLTAEQLLVETIKRVVAPDAWMSNGGGNCDLTCIGGVLVVLSHESVAEDVQDLVTDLKYQMKNQFETSR